MMKGYAIEAHEKKAKLFNEWEMFTSTDGESIESYYHHFSKIMNDFKRNKHFSEKIASNLKQIAQLGINMGQDRQMQTVGGNGGNQFGQYAVQNLGVPNIGNQNRLIVVPGIANPNANQNGNVNVVAARAEVRPRRMDATYLKTQLLISQKEEAGIQFHAEEFNLMAVARDFDEIDEVDVNCILMDNLQQTSTSGTQTDKALVYDSDGSAKVHHNENCYNNDIFNIFTQEQQYTELLETIYEPHQAQQNNSNVIFVMSSMEQSGGTIEQNPATVEETRALYDSVYNNLAIEVKKVNTIYRKMKETNAELTTELARYKNQEKKSKKASHKPKPIPNSKQMLHLHHMDLCGPMRVESINEKRYVLVIVDDYSRYTWVHFLRSKDEALEEIKTFLKKITVLLQAPVIILRTDNGIEFKNQVLKEYFDSVGISHQASSVRTPQQNGVMECKNHTLVEATRTMMIFLCALLFLWAEAIATTCYTQNHSIIHRRFDKTPYELINGRKLDISYLHVFGALYYPKNDREDIRKLGAKGVIGFFISYSANSCTYKIYNRRTKKIMEMMNVTFDELSAMAFEQSSSKPGLQSMASGQITAPRTAPANQNLQAPNASTTVEESAPISTPANSSSQSQNIPNTLQDVNDLSQQQHGQQQDTQVPLQSVIVADNVHSVVFEENTFVNPFAPPSKSADESSMEAIRIFLAYNAHKSFIVFQMDVKNAFLHVEKGIVWVKASTEGMIKYKLDLDKNGTPVDATKYHSMIGALMYLTSSRPKIIHATCLCPRYQAQPTEKHLKKDSSFELTGFSDADYAGCRDSFKSTSSGTQFLGEKLGTIELYFVKTDYQLADIFTKALLVDQFNYLVHRLGMRILSPQELERLAKSQESNTLSSKSCQGDSLNLPDHRIYQWRDYHIPAESQSRPHAYTQNLGYIQGINQDLKKALNFKDTLPQALINKNFLKEHQAHEYKSRSIQDYLKAKDQDIKIKSQDIMIKIKIQDHKHAKVYNWETAKYGKIWYDEDVHDLRSVETEFPAIVFNDEFSSEKTLSCEPTVSSLNNNEIDFRISFDESDDEDYMVIFDKNSPSYKIISANDLKTDSENDNEKVYMPLLPSPEPTVSCFDDLDFFKDFENEFPAIIYNDALTSKSDFLTEPTLSPQHINEFDLKDETSLCEYDEGEQNILYFNDLFPFNIIYPDNLKSDKDNDDNEIDIIQSFGGFVMEFDVNIMAWSYLNNGMLLNLIKNLYVPFGISFDPKRYYKDGVYTRMLRRP
ncbi:retrovirus-related pol polyprotein from transposon TNT 1-94, partial [Tanacetum coccineum]